MTDPRTDRPEARTAGADEPEADAPGSDGVVGQHPNRFAKRVGPLDEAPAGHTVTETDEASDESLPPGAPH